MISILKKRLITSIPLLIGITLISFALMILAPGDPTSMLANPQITTEDMAQIRENLGLDKPVSQQYFIWLKNILTGNFGYSYSTGQPVLTSILDRLPATLILSISSLVIILLITFPLGLISGYKKDSKLDHTITILSFLGLSVPTFWLGLMLILGLSLKLNLFPTSGYLDPYLMESGFWKQAANITYHLCLPLLAIVVGGIAGLTRYHRFGIIMILDQDYIKAARARGISEKRILFKHAFKNATLPIITLLGLQLPGLISGSFIIEYIFAWPGMGQLGVNAIFARDYPIIMGTLVLSSILIILGNLLADISYQLVDPRIQE
ncbi:peptide permease [Candidatus Marinamargulisbacteria bacterium SCGC AG-439-L15]|nr:peptide permease [Candidatus Marinamargulisbacteria bacterium SCGC AG-439-L15]